METELHFLTECSKYTDIRTVFYDKIQFTLIYDDANRACSVSTVTADRTGKFVLLTYSITASRCSTEAHLVGVPFPRSFDSRLALRQSCSARLKSLVWFGCKNTPVPRLKKKGELFLVKKKGTEAAVLSRVAKLRALLHGWDSDHNIVIAHLKGWGIKQTNHFNLGIESRWCLNHVRDL